MRKRVVPKEPDATSFGGLSRSELMSRIRSRSNKTTEIRMVALLRQHKLKGWRRHTKMPGRPDFVWPRLRVAIFVDGCFWHGHECRRNLTPKRNAEFWEKKIANNRRRDARIRRGLQKSGWSVIRIWECSLSRAPGACLGRIRAALRRRSPQAPGEV